jgi:hypothetical protein
MGVRGLRRATAALAILGSWLPLFAGPADSVTIYEDDLQARTNLPVTFGRAFLEGEIPGGSCPQPVAGGTPIAAGNWQADVKNAWPDGSVKFAVVSLIVPTLASGGSQTFTFQPAVCNNSGYLTQSQMINFNSGSWGAQITVTSPGNGSATANAATMLANTNPASQAYNDCSNDYWLRGPVVTAVVVQDCTSTTAFDFGWQWTGTSMTGNSGAPYTGNNQYASLHPWFVLYFYPSSGAVKAEMILENDWSTRWQDQLIQVSYQTGSALTTVLSYAGTPRKLTDLHMTSGSNTVTSASANFSSSDVGMSISTPFIDSIISSVQNSTTATIATNPNTTQSSVTTYIGDWFTGQRYRKTFWTGTGSPGNVLIDHNLAYLVTTGVFPRYDTNYSAGFSASAPGVHVSPDSSVLNRQGCPGGDYECFAQQSFSGVTYSDFGDRGGIGTMFEGFSADDEGAPIQREDLLYLYNMANDCGTANGQCAKGYFMLTAEHGARDAGLAAAVTGGAGDWNNVGNIPYHIRESRTAAGSSSGAYYCPGDSGINATPASACGTGQGLAFGKAISRYYSPTGAYGESGGIGTYPTGSAHSNGAWSIQNTAHWIDMAFVHYALTGDPYALDDELMQAGYATFGNPACNAPSTQCGFFAYQNPQGATLRQEAWGIETLYRARMFAPDGTIEQTYWDSILASNAEVLEGFANITGTPLTPSDTTCTGTTSTTANRWCWGRFTVASLASGSYSGVTPITQALHAPVAGVCMPGATGNEEYQAVTIGSVTAGNPTTLTIYPGVGKGAAPATGTLVYFTGATGSCSVLNGTFAVTNTGSTTMTIPVNTAGACTTLTGPLYGFWGGFGQILAATDANPVAITSGTIGAGEQIDVFGLVDQSAGTNWSTLNGARFATSTGSTTATLPVNTSAFPAFSQTGGFYTDLGLNLNLISDYDEEWMEHFWEIVLGEVGDSGVTYFNYVANDQFQKITEKLQDPTYNPYLVQAYVRAVKSPGSNPCTPPSYAPSGTPVQTSINPYISTWAGVKATFPPDVQALNSFYATSPAQGGTTSPCSNHSYGLSERAAAAYITNATSMCTNGVCRGTAAQQFIASNYPYFNNSPANGSPGCGTQDTEIKFALAPLEAACTINVTAPSANATITGYQYSLTAAVNSACTSADHVRWTVDSESACDPIRVAPYTCPWNPYYAANGSQHQAVATVYDSIGNVLAASPSVTFTVANTTAANNTNSSYAPGWTVTTGTPVTSAWSGTVNLTGTLSGTYPLSGVSCLAFVDGNLDGSSSMASGSCSYNLNTAQYLNGTHKVVFQYACPSNAVGCATVWGNFEAGAVSFTNAVSNVFLEASARESWLTPASTTASITGTIERTDGSTVAATITSCGTSSNTAVATVTLTGGACVATYAGNGSASFTLTESGGLTRKVWVYGYSSNVNPHFGTDGQIYNTWTSGKSLFLNSQFLTDQSDLDGSNNPPGVTSYLSNYLLAGWNAIEPSFGPVTLSSPQSLEGVAQSSFQSAANANINNFCTYAANAGLYLHISSDAWFRTYQYYLTRGTAATYSPSATQYLASQWALCNRVIANSAINGINSLAGTAPYQAAPQMGGTITQVVASSGTCTVTHGSTNAGLFSFETGLTNPTFIITGATSAGFNTAVGGAAYTASNLTDTTFQFGCAGAANGTYTSSNNPNMLFEVAFDQWYTLSPTGSAPLSVGAMLSSGTYTSGISATGTAGQTCTLSGFNGSGSGATATIALTGTNTIASGTAFTVSANGSGYTTAPTSASAGSGTAACSGTAVLATVLVDYTRWNGFQTDMTQYRGGASAPDNTWPNNYVTSSNAVQNWEYDPRMSSYADIYVNTANSNYLPASSTLLNGTIAGFGDHYRSVLGSTSEPFLMETQGTVSNYGLQGYSASIVSCLGNTITFTSDHGIRNIIPWSTRLKVSGSTGTTACNGDFWVDSAPNSTTLTVHQVFGTALTASSGTLTFADGHAYSLASPGITASSSATGYTAQTVNVVNAGGNTIACERGGTFTISGTGTALDGTKGYWPYNNPIQTSNCSTDGTTSGLWSSVPNFAGSGGTADINADNYMIYGRNSAFELTGPAFSYGLVMYCVELGCAGQRAYSWGIGGWDPEGISASQSSAGYSSTEALALNQDFGDTSAGNTAIQFGALEGTPASTAEDQWWAMGSANLKAQRFAPCEFQPHLPSPDYGPFLEASAHAGTLCNMLVIQNMSASAVNITVNTAPYLVSGQNYLRYLGSYTGDTVTTIVAGITSDTPLIPASGTATYIFPANFSTWLSQPSIAPRLADIAGATAVTVHWGYLPWWVDNGTMSYDCGSTSTCTPPWDRGIGTIYYRLLYRNSAGAILARSDIQSF